MERYWGYISVFNKPAKLSIMTNYPYVEQLIDLACFQCLECDHCITKELP